MKLFYCFLLWFSFLQIAYTQCTQVSTLTFDTQEEVDAFIIDYPNCIDYTGSININGNTITNLSGLENLNSIGGFLYIRNNELVTLAGLANLTSIGGYLRIENNPVLANLNGLENLNTIDGYLKIKNNGVLANLNGLANLSNTGDYIEIHNSNLLADLTGLDNLTSVGGYLSVESNEGLMSLGGLGSLTSVNGNLNIKDNPALVGLNSLNNLTTLNGGLLIDNNDALINLVGLESLTAIGGNLFLWFNDALETLSGLNNITSIGTYFLSLQNDALTSLNDLNSLTTIGEYLVVESNDLLTDFSGLENLVSIGEYLSINANQALTSLEGLENLNSIGGNLEIGFNSNLSSCSITSICDYLVSSTSIVSISNNAPGCDSETEVTNLCGERGNLNFRCFYDLNENALKDNGEPYLPAAAVTIEPGAYTVYGNTQVGGIKYLDFGDYVISLNESDLPDWNLTTTLSSYNVSLNDTNNSDTVYYGLFPNANISDISTNCVNGLPRCNEFVKFEAVVANNGTNTANGTLWFNLDESVLESNFIDAPDTIVGADRFGWYFTDLFPQQVAKKQISLRLPGPPDFPVGDSLSFDVEANFSDETTAAALVNFEHKVEVPKHRKRRSLRCSHHR